MSVFDPVLEDLPPTLPLFPLTGALLLPRGLMPLNVFEPRYLAMTEDALKEPARLIGMIQPERTEEEGPATPALYRTGCAGRIVQFEETEDGRYLIHLKGVARFRLMEELATTRGYRRAKVDWGPFAADLREPDESGLDRGRLLAPLRRYLEQQRIEANWDAIREMPEERLVVSLAMSCPFAPAEKQALLEADDLSKRADVLCALLEMATLDTGGDHGGTQ